MSSTYKFVLLALPALGLARPATAQIVNGTITGTVTQNTLGLSGVSVGSVVSGTYSYDLSLVSPDLFGRQGNLLTVFTLQVGSFSHLFTLTDLNSDQFSRERLLSFSMPPVDSLEFFFNSNALNTYFGPNVNSQTISNALPQNYNASSTAGSLAFNFAATSSPAAVPEPGSLALLAGMGLTGAGFLARRRKNACKAA